MNWNDEYKMPDVEGLNKTDIYFGNENNSDIQSQPYILIKKRMPVSRTDDRMFSFLKKHQYISVFRLKKRERYSIILIGMSGNL